MEIQHPYNEAEIARIRRQLELATKSNNPQAFEINADGYRVVHRTTDLEQFDEGMNMLPEDFEVMEVKIFYGGANVNDNHQFLRNYSPPAHQQQQQQTQSTQQNTQQQYQQYAGQNLSGPQSPPPAQPNLDWVDQRVKQSIETERAKWNTEQLEKENASLKESIRQKDAYITQLEHFALNNSNKGFSWEQLEGVASTALRMYGQYQANKQGNLAGAPQPQQQTAPSANDAEYEQEEEVSEFEKHLRALIEQVNTTFNPFQAKVFIDLLEEAVLQPHLLPEVLKFLRARVYQKRNPHRRRQNRTGQHYQQQPGQQQQPFTVSHSQNSSDDMNDHDEDDHDQTT